LEVQRLNRTSAQLLARFFFVTILPGPQRPGSYLKKTDYEQDE